MLGSVNAGRDNFVLRRLFNLLSVNNYSVLVALASFFLLIFGLWDQEFVGFEARFGLFANEMYRNGLSFFPTTYGEPYPDYPATSTVMIYLFSLLMGGVNKLSAVLPTAIASTAVVTLTYLLLASYSRRWAIMSVFIALLTQNFLKEARSISIDQWVSLCTVGVVYLAYQKSAELPRTLQLQIIGILMFGYLVRGPFGVVIPTGVIFVYYLSFARYKNMLIIGVMGMLVLLIGWAVLLGLAYWEGGETFVQRVIDMQFLSRLDREETRNSAYYFTTCVANYALAYPMALMVLMLLPWCYKNLDVQERTLLRIFSLWIAVVIIGMSIPATKKARYILPIVPAISALAAYPFVVLSNSIMANLGRLFRIIFLVWPALLLALVIYGQKMVAMKHYQVNIPFTTVYIILFLVASLSLLVYLYKRHQQNSDYYIAGFALLATWIVNLAVIEPVVLQTQGSREFVEETEKYRQQLNAEVVFFKVSLDAAPISYLVNVDQAMRIDVMQNIQEISQIKKPTLLLIGDDDLVKEEAVLTKLAPPLVQGRFNNAIWHTYLLAGRQEVAYKDP